MQGLQFVILLAVLLQVNGSPISETQVGCPKLCRCEKEIAYCNLMKLVSVPSCDDCGNILYLDLSHNNIEELSDNAFSDFPNLKQINVERNQIHSIDTTAFEGLKNLVKNSIDVNNFTALDPNTFIYNTHLTSLSLRENPLVISSPFLASATLTSLDLSDCALTALPNDTFVQLFKLETIMLQNNYLKELPKDIFAPLIKLQRIYLHGNPWHCGGYLKNLMESKKDLIADFSKIHCLPRDVEQPVEVHQPYTDVPKRQEPEIMSSTPASTASSLRIASLHFTVIVHVLVYMVFR